MSPRALLDLYRNTHYDVRMPGGLRCTVRIGQPLPLPLREFPMPVGSTFLVSACNPWSLPLTTTENRQRMRELLRCVKEKNWQCLPGVGHIPGQPWREPFLLLVGTSTRNIDEIASQYEQNAVVHLQAEQYPRLRIYRPDWQPETCQADDIEWSTQSHPVSGIR